jgi:hypothetical protein
MTSRPRAIAFRHLGRFVDVADPHDTIPDDRLLRRILYRTGYRLTANRVPLYIQSPNDPNSRNIASANDGCAIAISTVRWLRISQLGNKEVYMQILEDIRRV